MNEQERNDTKAMIRALLEDYSEFISRRATAYSEEIKKHPSDIPHSVKLEKMAQWVEEFIEVAVNQFVERN